MNTNPELKSRIRALLARGNPDKSAQRQHGAVQRAAWLKRIGVGVGAYSAMLACGY